MQFLEQRRRLGPAPAVSSQGLHVKWEAIRSQRVRVEKLGGDLWRVAVGTSPEVVVISSPLLAAQADSIDATWQVPGGLRAETGVEVSLVGMQRSHMCTRLWRPGGLYPQLVLWVPPSKYVESTGVSAHHGPHCHQEQASAPGHFDYGKALTCLSPAPALATRPFPTPPQQWETTTNTSQTTPFLCSHPAFAPRRLSIKASPTGTYTVRRLWPWWPLTSLATASPAHLVWLCWLCPACSL